MGKVGTSYLPYPKRLIKSQAKGEALYHLLYFFQNSDLLSHN